MCNVRPPLQRARSSGLSGLSGLSGCFGSPGGFAGPPNKTDRIDQINQIGQTDSSRRAFPASRALLALCLTDQTDRPPPFSYISVLGQTTQNPELITQNFPKRVG